MKPKWQKLASLAQEICTLWFQFVGAVFASKGYTIKNVFDKISHFLMEMFLAPLPLVLIFHNLFVLRGCVLMFMTSKTETYF